MQCERQEQVYKQIGTEQEQSMKTSSRCITMQETDSIEVYGVGREKRLEKDLQKQIIETSSHTTNGQKDGENTLHQPFQKVKEFHQQPITPTNAKLFDKHSFHHQLIELTTYTPAWNSTSPPKSILSHSPAWNFTKQYAAEVQTRHQDLTVYPSKRSAGHGKLQKTRCTTSTQNASKSVTIPPSGTTPSRLLSRNTKNRLLSATSLPTGPATQHFRKSSLPYDLHTSPTTCNSFG
ncbi:hypothetical protein FRC02_011451 [Tulasnella sp. 418]|nr:hypothetical protein FRC02_011451 [Tulasnella sp. 418]